MKWNPIIKRLTLLTELRHIIQEYYDWNIHRGKTIALNNEYHRRFKWSDNMDCVLVKGCGFMYNFRPRHDPLYISHHDVNGKCNIWGRRYQYDHKTDTVEGST